MNICIIIDCLGVGGAERVTMTLANTLLEGEHTVTIVTIDPDIQISIDPRINIYTLYFEKKIFKYRYNRLKMYTLLEQIQSTSSMFDLVLVHLYKSSRIMKYYQHPCIYHVVHSTQSQSALKDKKGYARWRAREKIRSVYNDLNLICVSQGVQTDLLNTMRVNPKSIQTIYNPFDIPDIRDKSQQKIIIPIEEDYFVFVGRLVKEKRIDYLLEAYKKSNIPQHLLIIGDGEELEALTQQTEILRIKHKIHFIGSVSNPYPLIKKAECLILCSLYEGLPTVLIEALILQTPVMSTDCPSGPREILPYYSLDALVEDNFNNDALVDKLIEFSKQRPIVNHTCVDSFSSDHIAKKYLELSSLCQKDIKLI